MAQTPRVVFHSIAEAPALSLDWDVDAHVLAVEITESVGIARPTENLSERLSEQFEMERAERIVIGKMELALDRSRAFAGFELRTNPETWQQTSLRDLPESLDSARAELQADFDANGIASLDATVDIVLDTGAGQLSFVFDDYVAGKWALVSDRLAVGVTLDDRFAEIRLLDFSRRELG